MISSRKWPLPIASSLMLLLRNCKIASVPSQLEALGAGAAICIWVDGQMVGWADWEGVGSGQWDQRVSFLQIDHTT